jgi:general secretion pathway protein K
MIEAWDDWQDLNDQASINGAEAAYYADLENPYKPRNGKLEAVEEILLIRGFAEVFSDVDLDAAFTLYGENELINLNLATVEAMQLLPGLDDALIAEILAYRVDNEFSGNGDVAQIVPVENMAELRPWLNSRKMTAYYSIMVYPATPAAGSSLTSDAQADADAADLVGEELAEQASTAFTEVVEITGFTDLPKILKINPYQTIPLRGMVATINERNSADKP